MRFHFLTPVWGEDFTRRYVDFFLPAQLHNLLPGETYKIVTTPESAAIIERSAAFKALAASMNARILRLPDASKDNYRRMIQSYEIGMRDPDVEVGNTAFIYLTPDSVWSSGAFQRVRELSKAGFRAVMIFGQRASLESFVPAYRAASDPRLLMGSRDLARLTLQHLHQIIRSFMFGQEFYNTHPAALFWPSPAGLVCRAFVYHPLMLMPRHRVMNIEETIDYDLIPSTVSREEIHVVTDSDEILGVDVARSDYDQGVFGRGSLEEKHVVAWFANGWPTRFHKWLGRHTVFTHHEELRDADREVAAAGAKVMSRIYRKLALLSVREALTMRFLRRRRALHSG